MSDTADAKSSTADAKPSTANAKPSTANRRLSLAKSRAANTPKPKFTFQKKPSDVLHKG